MIRRQRGKFRILPKESAFPAFAKFPHDPGEHVRMPAFFVVRMCLEQPFTRRPRRLQRRKHCAFFRSVYATPLRVFLLSEF